MSRFWPHPAYTEDQPLAHTILTTHVLTRAVTTGAIIGAGIYGTRDIYRRLARTSAKISSPASPSPSLSPKVASLVATPSSFLRTVGVSTAWTLGVVGLGLVGRMWGREVIEWQDRAWRLLENKGQLETDDWTYGGLVAGLAAAGLAARAGGGSSSAAAGGGGFGAVASSLGWRGLLGAAGSGSVVGVAGYMIWRYGVNKGRFPS